MDSNNGCKHWVKRTVQNLTLMDRRLWRGLASTTEGVFWLSLRPDLISIIGVVRPALCQRVVGQHQQVEVTKPAHVAKSRTFCCRQHGSTAARGLEGLLSDRREALLKSNRGEKALRILDHSAARTGS